MDLSIGDLNGLSPTYFHQDKAAVFSADPLAVAVFTIPPTQVYTLKYTFVGKIKIVRRIIVILGPFKASIVVPTAFASTEYPGSSPANRSDQRNPFD